MRKVGNEFEWLNIPNLRPFLSYTEFHRISQLGAKCVRLLEEIKFEMLKGTFVPSHFLELRSTFLQLVYQITSFLRTYRAPAYPAREETEGERRFGSREGNAEESDPVREFTVDLQLLVKYMMGHEVAMAVNLAVGGKYGEINGVLGIIETVLNGIIHSSIKDAFDEVVAEIPEKVITNMLKRGGLLPKFKAEKPKEVGA